MPNDPFNTIYRRLLRPIMFRLPPELAHRVALWALKFCSVFFPSNPVKPELPVRLWQLEFPNPVGLAAGMDKDAVAVLGWQQLGFGFVELGTVTPKPQAGNPKPRLWRVPSRRALVNRLGFPSAGVDVMERNLRDASVRGVGFPVGVSLGPNKDTPPDKVVDDFQLLITRLAKYVDFLVINLSSPNTPGLRRFEIASNAEPLLSALIKLLHTSDPNDSVKSNRPERQPYPPLLVKLGPDLSKEDLRDTCQVLLRCGVSGIVATNTSIDFSLLPELQGAVSGGISGEPLRERSRETVRHIFRFTEGKVPIIGVGGIASAEDAYRHVRAGASLIELYSGLVYEGPGLIKRIKQDLSAILERDGFDSLQEAVGKDA